MEKKFKSDVMHLSCETPVVVEGIVTTSREEWEFWGSKGSNLVDRFNIQRIIDLETGLEIEVSQEDFEALEKALIIDEIY